MHLLRQILIVEGTQVQVIIKLFCHGELLGLHARATADAVASLVENGTGPLFAQLTD
jgi:hypothetical protein